MPPMHLCQCGRVKWENRFCAPPTLSIEDKQKQDKAQQEVWEAIAKACKQQAGSG